MSGLVFPAYLLGEKFTSRKTPNFNTKTQKALSGKESRISYRAYPLYEWELTYEFLSDQFSQRPSRTNFLPFSQDFTQWSVANGGAGFSPFVIGSWVSIAAPDGTYTADRIILNLAGGSTSGDYSFVYVPLAQIPLPVYAATLQFTFSVYLRTNDGTTVNVEIVLGSKSYVASVGPTWQRYTVSSLGMSQAPQIGLYGVGSSSQYADLSAWGAQVEYGATPSAYIFTNGTAVRASDLKSAFGFFSQMLGSYDTFLYQDPDFNSVDLYWFATGDGTTNSFNLTAAYQPGAEIPQFLYGPSNMRAPIGPAGVPEWVQNTIGAPIIYTGRYDGPEMLSTGLRSNLALQSNFAATWGTTAGALTTNVIAAPDGTTTAAQFTEGTTSTIYAVGETQTGFAANARYTFSVWLKYGSRQYVMLNLDDGSANGNVFCFDLINGLIAGPLQEGTAYSSAADATMTAFPNGWWRCSISGQIASTSLHLAIVHTPTFAATWYPGFTGTSAFTYLWGAQLEGGALPSALIPTTTAHLTNGGSDYTLTNVTQVGTSVYTFQQVHMVATPANGIPLLWSGSFFYRCRFSEDKIDFKENMAKIWELSKLPLEQVIL